MTAATVPICGRPGCAGCATCWSSRTEFIEPRLDADEEERVHDAALAESATVPTVGRADTAARRVRLVRASDVRMERARWAWAERLPLGALALIVGQGGRGKSTIAYHVAARLTRGQLDGDLRGSPADVVIATAEDALAQVAKPRLAAAGADLARCHFVEVAEGGIAGGLSLPGDFDGLAAAVEQADARLLVLDPVVAFLHGGIDAHRDQDVRRVLAPLVRLAERLPVAVACVLHLNKAATTDVMTRVSGSVGFPNAARVVLFAGPDPSDEARSILLPVKNNLAALGPGLAYRIEPATVTEDGETFSTQQVAWLGEVAGVTAREMLGPNDDERGARDEAGDFLLAILADGPVPAKRVLSLARDAGIAERTVRRAKSGLGIVSTKAGAPGEPSEWSWSLPEDGQDSPKVATRTSGHLRQDVATFDKVEGDRPDPEPRPDLPSAGVCDRCGARSYRRVLHNATGEELCESCCQTEYPEGDG